MHIPDGFLDARTWVSATAVSAGAVGYGLVKVRQTLEERLVPRMGLAAAFIFAAQMINFPVSGGTSGHLIGALLAAIVLGPWAASVVVTAVLIVQAFVFLDGGITALGANVLNMALVGTFAGYLSCRLLGAVWRTRAGLLVATFVGAWLSVVLAAVAASLELAVSGTIPLSVVLPAMLSWHALIGLGEGVITTAIVSFLLRTRPDFILITGKGGAAGESAVA